MQESNIVRVYGVRLWAICSLIWLTGCSSNELKVPIYNSPDLTPVWSETDQIMKEHRVEGFAFTNQNGESFGSKELDESYYVANFFFTSCPSICPRMTENLKVVANHFVEDSEVAIVSFSVTPGLDSVSRLKDYHEARELTPNWHLLTGNQAEIYKLSRQSYFVEEEIGFSKDSSDFLHTERCLLIDKQRRIRGVYNATVALDMERLVTDIELLKASETQEL